MARLEEWPKNDQEVLWFVEVTFDFVTAVEEKTVEGTIGCYLLQPNNKSLYVQAKPFSQHNLEQHAKSIHIDLKSAPPKAMAGMMAKALLEIQKNNKKSLARVHSKDDSSTLELELFYQDLEENGILSLDVQRQTSALDGLSILTLYQAIQNPPAVSKEPEASNDQRQLLQEFQQWACQKEEEGKVGISSNIAAASQSKKRANLQIHQFQPLKKRSKKKKKISYAKS